MALQHAKLEQFLRQDGLAVSSLASNLPLPGWLKAAERWPGIRTALRTVYFCLRMTAEAARADVTHVLAASWLYFFVVVYPAVLAGRLFGNRVVLNYRGGEARRFFRRWGLLARPVFALAHCVTAPSAFLAGVIEETFGVPVQIVPNLVDVSAFRFRQREAIQPHLLVTRHLEPVYDIETVIRAFQVVQQRHLRARLWIAGGGSQEQHLKELVSSLELRNVRFLGAVPHRELPMVYDRCDILINASRVDNFPGALVEASSAGLPIASTNAGGIRFMYENRKSALLVEPGDWRGLAEAVDALLDDPTLVSEMVHESLKVARNCSWPQVREWLYRAYGLDAAPQASKTGRPVYPKLAVGGGTERV
jgi:phenylacetate-CoA ligase